MKTLTGLFIVCCGLVVIKASMTEEQKQAFQKLLKNCAEKEKASQADIDDFLARTPAVEPQAKCFRACLHETLGSMKNNKFSREGFLAKVDITFEGDAEKIKIANEVADTCANEEDSDRCEAGAKICKCLIETSRAKGLIE
uniref:Odorant-binding protein 45 n=1 Tax=Bradysia odoriphaga TaxID=1564500 RepID=A0A2S0X9J7_9DIPT|nr:odorant-binding protein 45 [Bradysia odoriphaga]